MGIESYIKQFVTRTPVNTSQKFDRYGKPNYSSSETIKVRLRECFKRMVDRDGNNFTIDAEMWLLPTQSLNLEDKITYESEDYKVFKIDIPRKLSGSKNHKKAFLIKTTE